MLDFHKMAVTLSVLWITTAPTMTLASAQEAALSEGERRGLAACLVKCPDGDKACVNRCMSKSQTRGVVWSDATRACIRACRTGYQLSQVAAQQAANELIFDCVASCLDRMVR
jgi:hypothetical protein